MGRLWQTLILTLWKSLFAHVPVESLVRARQSEYYQAIRESSSQGESTPFVAFMLDAILAAVRTPQEAPHVTPQVRRLLSVLAGEMSRRDILHALGLSDRKSLRERRPTVPAFLAASDASADHACRSHRGDRGRCGEEQGLLIAPPGPLSPVRTLPPS